MFFVLTSLFMCTMVQRPSARSIEFYATAKKEFFEQALGICGVDCFTCLAIAFRHLTPFGRNTPIIGWTIQVSRAVLATVHCAFVGGPHLRKTFVAPQLNSRTTRVRRLYVDTFSASLFVAPTQSSRFGFSRKHYFVAPGTGAG